MMDEQYLVRTKGLNGTTYEFIESKERLEEALKEAIEDGWSHEDISVWEVGRKVHFEATYYTRVESLRIKP